MTRDELKEVLNDYAVAYHVLTSADNYSSAQLSARRKINAAKDVLLVEFARLTAALTQISEMEISSDTCKDHAMRAIAKAALNPQEAQS